MSEPLFEGHTRSIDTTSEHHMEWTFDQDSVHAKLVCSSGPDADCHLTAACLCESWHIQRDEANIPFHLPDGDWGDDSGIAGRHYMKPGPDCNVVDWINADDAMECASFPDSLLIARTPVKPTWQGDYYDWAPIDPPTTGVTA